MPKDATKKIAWARKVTILSAVIVGVIVAAFGLALLLAYRAPIQVHIGSATITARLADTTAARTQGLSDVASLPADQGMLFVFDSDEQWRFWMKGMHFNLDMIWLNADKKVVWIAADESPSTYPQTTFAPPTPARYVLELVGGTAKVNNITVGAQADFALSK